MAAHWRDVDYFTYLLKDVDSACSALEYMVDDLHLDKDHTVGIFLDHAGSEDFLWSLVKFLGNSNPRYVISLCAQAKINMELWIPTLTWVLMA